MTRKRKKKSEQKTRTKSKIVVASTEKVLSMAEVSSENIVRLKLTVRKGARIESVPLKKLEKLSTNPRTYWKLEDGWLMLYGLH